MPNALSQSNSTTPPPPPNPEMQPGGGTGGAPAQQQPAPTHAQVVAALRHFAATGKELRGLLKNPDLGKSNIRPAIIDAVTRLVSKEILSPVQAVQQLAGVPDRPFDQKTLLQQMYAQTIAAEVAVLDHHRNANLGTGDWGLESAQHVDNSDEHQGVMNGMMGQHYGRQQ